MVVERTARAGGAGTGGRMARTSTRPIPTLGSNSGEELGMPKRRRSTAASKVIVSGTLICGASLMSAGATFRPFTVYACVALLYFALCFPVSAYAHRLERKLR